MNIPYFLYSFVSGQDYAEVNLPVISVLLLLNAITLACRLHSASNEQSDSRTKLNPLGLYLLEVFLTFIACAAIVVPVILFGRATLGTDYDLDFLLVMLPSMLVILWVACWFHPIARGENGIGITRTMKAWTFVETATACIAGTLSVKILVGIGVYILFRVSVNALVMTRSATKTPWKIIHGIGTVLFFVVLPCLLFVVAIFIGWYLELIAGAIGGIVAISIYAKEIARKTDVEVKRAVLRGFKASARHEKIAIVISLAFLATMPIAFSSSSPSIELTMVPMRDGVRLATIVYRPAQQYGPMPVLLLRTPYDQDGPPFHFEEGALDWYYKGYVVVTQDVRGRFLSEGTWDGMLKAADDAYDTCAWIVAQPWCNGKIGTYSGSAMGIVQLFAAGAGSPGLAAQDISVATGDMYDTFFRQGVWDQGDVGEWIRGNAGGDWLNDEFLAHPNKTAYWYNGSLSMGNKYANVNTRSILVGGWYDIFAQPTVDAFCGYYYNGTSNARGHQKLVIGPWPHAFNTEYCGQLWFRNGKNSPVNRWRDAIFQENLIPEKISNGIFGVPTLWTEPNIAYYMMGDVFDPNCDANEWRYTNDWPVSHVDTPLYLQTDGSLAWAAPGSSRNYSYLYDPLHPMQTIGGTNLVYSDTLTYNASTIQVASIGTGPWDQRPLLTRPDVLVFNSSVLASPVNVVGRVKARFWISSNCTDTDFVAKLCDVYPTGHSMNVVEGIASVRKRGGLDKDLLIVPGNVYEIEIDLWSTAYQFNAGHRIQLVVSSSNAPKYQPCPNTGAPIARTYARTVVANNSILVGPLFASQVVLPIIQ